MDCGRDPRVEVLAKEKKKDLTMIFFFPDYALRELQ